MSYTPDPFPPRSYAPPGGPAPRRGDLGLVGGIVVGCTALLLGSILLIAFLVNRGQEPTQEVAVDGGTADVNGEEVDTSPGEDGGSSPAGGGPEEVAVSVAKILYGVSDESSEGLICSSPGAYLSDVEGSGQSMRDTLGEDYIELIEDIVVMDSYEEGNVTLVEIGWVIFDTETDAGTFELVVEDGDWKACDFTF